MPKRLRAAIWAGVSSRPQTERDSLDDQLRDGRALAERDGWQIVAELVVPGESRGYVDLPEAIAELQKELRPGEANAYRQLLELIDGRKIDVLVVAGRDRLGRMEGLVTSIEDRLKRIGAYVHSLRVPPSGSRTADIYSSAIERANLRDEIERLTERHRRGMDGRARRGMLIGPQPPFGYTVAMRQEGSRLIRYAVVDQGEAATYRWLVDVILSREQTIEDLGGRMRALYPQRQWSVATFSSLMRNPFHAGLIWRRRKRWPDEHATLIVLDPGVPSLLQDPAWPEVETLLLGRAQRRLFRGVDQQTLQTKVHLVGPGEHEPLIRLEYWLELQRLMEAQSEFRRPWSLKSTWAGILRCGLCGSPMHFKGQPQPGYYYCAHRKPSRGGCRLPYVRSDRIAHQVADVLRTMFAREEASLIVSDATPAAADVAGWKRQLGEVATQRERLMELYEMRRVTLEEFDRRAAKLEAAQTEIRMAMAEVELRTETANARRERVAGLASVLPDFEERIAAANPSEINRWLRALFSQIVIGDDGAVREVHLA